MREVRRALGDPERDVFSNSLAVDKTTLAAYERGQRTPDADTLARYRELHGIDINWLVTGDGQMFVDLDKAPKPQVVIEKSLMKKLARLAMRVYRDAGVKLPPEEIASEAADLFNDLVAKVTNIRDTGEVDAVFPQLEYRLKKRLSENEAPTSSGKRSA